MTNLNLEEFNPALAELHKLVEATKSITVDDLTDAAQIKIVHTNRLTLRNARVAITKKGKELREEAVAFQKAVIAREKDLVAIIEPEEDRLQQIEDAAAELAETEKRKALTPFRMSRLTAIGDGVNIPEDELLRLDDKQFEEYYNARLAVKNEADRQAIDAEKRAIENEKARIAREQEIRDAEERARQQERERMERAEQERKAREEREKQEAIEKERRDKEEAAARDKVEQARLKREKRYKEFRAEHGVTEATKSEFKEERVGIQIILWKKVGVFTTTQ